MLYKRHNVHEVKDLSYPVRMIEPGMMMEKYVGRHLTYILQAAFTRAMNAHSSRHIYHRQIYWVPQPREHGGEGTRHRHQLYMEAIKTLQILKR